MWPKRKKSLTLKQLAVLEKLVALAFSQRRKMLSNNLGNLKNLLDLDTTTLKSRRPRYLGRNLCRVGKTTR
jgi:16S rRNA (adenine1518-N6/adenine1519-N6)-dimethyltransferase